MPELGTEGCWKTLDRQKRTGIRFWDGEKMWRKSYCCGFSISHVAVLFSENIR